MYTIFSFILIALTLHTVLQVSNMILETDTVIAKFTNRVEIAQINAIKQVGVRSESLWVYIKYLLQTTVSLLNNSTENKLELARTLQWNGRECVVIVIVVMDSDEYKHTMSSVSTRCIPL